MKTSVKAMLFMTLAAGTMGLTQVFLRFANTGDEAVVFQLSFFTYGLTAVALGVLALRRRAMNSAVARRAWAPLTIFGASDALATLLLFLGSLRLPLVVNSVVSDLHILITPLILAGLRLERVGSFQYLAIAIGMLGAALVTGIAQAADWGASQGAMLLPLSAAGLWCASSLAARRLSGVPKELPQISVALYGIVASALFLVFLRAPIWPEVGHVGYFVLAVAVAILSQVFFVVSLTSGDVVAAIAGIPAYAFFGAVLGYIFFKEALEADQIGGVLAILVGLVLFSMTKEVASK